MKANYKNWVPKGMTVGFGVASALLAATAVGVGILGTTEKSVIKTTATAVLGIGAVGCGAFSAWCAYAGNKFSYDVKRKLSKQIVEGTAEYVSIPDGGIGLDVGCGSGALTIACAKRNPKATMIGIDRWGKEYASFSKKLCEENAISEKVTNTRFQNGNAIQLDFPDETFDAVTSNYVYHNIIGKNKQELLRETLRVLKKGGTFAIHDIMSKSRYGDMQKFVSELKAEGYEEVKLIDTTNGKFMSRKEAKTMFLDGSALLVGRK